MRLTVLGATGGIGRHIVAHALADGHEVTAAVRDPARLPVRHQNLQVVRANALDAASVKESIEGADAVLSGIGTADRRNPLKPASTSAQAVVEAMLVTGASGSPQQSGRDVSALCGIGPELTIQFQVDRERSGVFPSDVIQDRHGR